MRHRDVPKLVYLANPKSPHAEAYRTMRTNIQYSSVTGSQEFTTLMVTSTEPGEGKTTTVCNLALAMAHAGKKTLLIDADLRRSAVHQVFRLPNACGLANILSEEAEPDECIVSVTDFPLYVLTAGKRLHDPAEVLASGQMGDLLRRLREDFDQILLDAPPVLPVTDAQLLSNQVEGVILVLRSGHVQRQQVLRAKQLLEHVSANLIGVVLNQTHPLTNQTYYYGDDT